MTFGEPELCGLLQLVLIVSKPSGTLLTKEHTLALAGAHELGETSGPQGLHEAAKRRRQRGSLDAAERMANKAGWQKQKPPVLLSHATERLPLMKRSSSRPPSLSPPSHAALQKQIPI